MLDLVVRDGRLPRNPATGVRLPRAAKGEAVFLTHTQVEQLARGCPGYELFVRVLTCGLPGGAVGLVGRAGLEPATQGL